MITSLLGRVSRLLERAPQRLREYRDRLHGIRELAAIAKELVRARTFRATPKHWTDSHSRDA